MESYIFSALKAAMARYAPVTDSTWQGLRSICKTRQLGKGEKLYVAGVIPNSFAFIYRGLLRGYVCDENGAEYNKNFFDEGKFPGAMTSLLTQTPSLWTFEALEDAVVVEINFAAYRRLLVEKDDLKLFHIHYLESNWLLAKDAREIEIVQSDASERYLQFLEQYPALADRLPQYHIASHLGITPTQLSRIRKALAR